MDFERMPGERGRGRAFGEREVAPSVARRDQESRWEEALFARLGGAGLLSAPLARDAGGEGLGALGLSELLRGFMEGSTDAGLALAWAAQIGAARRIEAEGTAEQRRRLLPPLARGEAIGAWARREVGRSGDPLGISTRAVARGDQWTLDGVKSWVVSGGVASVLVVDAVTDVARGKDGISTFLVPSDAPGVRVARRHSISGLRTAVIGEVAFEGVEIPARDRLGTEGAAFGRAALRGRSWERVTGSAIGVGLLRAVVDQTIARSRESIHLGRPLAHCQAARATLVDLRIQVELAERLQARAAWQLDGPDPNGRGAERDIAVASLFVARALAWVTREAARLQGELGAGAGQLAERSVRDAAGLAHLAEREETLRSAIGGALLNLPPAQP